MNNMTESRAIRTTDITRNTLAESENKRLQQLTTFDVVCIIISLGTFVTDLATDILLVVEYWYINYMSWCIYSLCIVLIPTLTLQVFSLRWLMLDSSLRAIEWITHAFLSGVIHRYVKIIQCSLSSVKERTNIQIFYTQRTDLVILHLFETLLQSAPQLILQFYCIVQDKHITFVRALSISTSIWSIIWSCFTYNRDVITLSTNNKLHIKYTSILVKSCWYILMLFARIASLIFFTVIFGLWTLVPLAIHWIAMFVWILTQKTTFCSTKTEEVLYNAVIAFTYCFSFINLKEGKTRYRLLIYYSVMLTQNLASLLIFLIVSDSNEIRQPWAVVCIVLIVVGSLIGILCMLVYYRWFHPKGPILWKNVLLDDEIEINNKKSVRFLVEKQNESSTISVRSLKSISESVQETSQIRNNTDSQANLEAETTDKKLLLNHWISRSGSPTFVSAPIIANSSLESTAIEIFALENTPQTLETSSQLKNTNKIKLKLNVNKLENFVPAVEDVTNIQKRRGICSSDELKENIELNSVGRAQKAMDHSSELSQDTDSSNKKTSSGSIDLDLDLSLSDINSSDINVFNENIVQKLCLSTLKNIKDGNQDADIQNIQKIALEILKEMYTKKDKNKNGILSREVDTPTEILSVHDYENICAVNIAREAWGLRSWKGYADIENWLHDGSVFRERRNDTLTSASSEISSISQELRNNIFLAPPVPSRKFHIYSNIIRNNSKEEYVDVVYDNTKLDKKYNEGDIFIAKPCLVDNINHLEPIIEEIDDLGDVDTMCKPRLNSESSLVATIDEIRKSTISNSPRNVYHRRENLWDSPICGKDSLKLETNIKKTLWKEPSKLDVSNTLQNEQFESHKTSAFINKTSPRGLSNTIYNLNVNDDSSSFVVSKLPNKIPQKNSIRKRATHDFTNVDIEYLSQLVAETDIPIRLSSIEELAANQLTSSLKSLIVRDISPTTVNSQTKQNIKRNGKNKPRRKFSILREKFEQKVNEDSDKEVLCKKPEQTLSNSEYINTLALNESDKVTSSSNVCFTLNRDESLPPLTSDIRDKQSLFLKQVLSPNKIRNKLG